MFPNREDEKVDSNNRKCIKFFEHENETQQYEFLFHIHVYHMNFQ